MRNEIDFVPNAQVRRIFTIIRILISKRVPANINDIAEELKERDIPIPSRRTLQRDIKEIEALGYHIALGNGKYLLQNREEIANKHFTDDEVQALQMSRSVFRYFDGTHLKNSIDNALNLIVGTKRSDMQNQLLEELEDNFMVHLGPHRKLAEKEDIIDDIIYSINSRHLLVLNYKKPNQEVEKVVVAPYKLVLYRDTLYILVLKMNADDTLRIYNISRIEDAEVTSDKFNRNQKLIERYEEAVAHSFGISVQGDLKDIEITFDKCVANAIKEREWHSSQDIEEDDNSITLKLKVLDNGEIISWILGWGKNVIDIKPQNFKERVLEIRG